MHTKLLVVGCGRMGQIRMRASRIIPNLQLYGIVDENLDAAKQFGQQYETRHASSIESFIKNEGLPDAIWLTTPTPTHEPLIQQAASLCIPVATEKPVAMDPVSTERCYKFCSDAGVPLFCSLQRRVDHNYQEIQQHIQDGLIGNVQSMHSTFRDHPIPPIEYLLHGGELFHDYGVHDIDFARSLLKGHEINAVYALAHSFNDILRDNGVKDVGNGLLRFDNDVMYGIEICMTATYGYDQRFEVFGDKGCVKTNNVHASSCSLETANGVNKPCYEYSFPQRYETAFRVEMERFVNVLNGTEEPFVSCLDACRAIQVGEACRLSVLHGVSVNIEYDADTVSKCQYKYNENPMQIEK
eukprot:235390_1